MGWSYFLALVKTISLLHSLKPAQVSLSLWKVLILQYRHDIGTVDIKSGTSSPTQEPHFLGANLPATACL